MANILTETILYDAGGTSMDSYLAYDADQSGTRPGILVIHEWWGLDDYIKGRCEQLAGMGYCALGVDMYGDGETGTSPDEAGALMDGVLGDMSAGSVRLGAALACLKDQSTCDASKTAAIGYCFGGAMVLHMARTGMDLRGVVSFHGALGSFHKPAPGTVKAKVLVCHGAADALVPDDDINAFHEEMKAAGANYEFIAYEGALHGFSNPAATTNGDNYGLPLAYDEGVDNKSWEDMQNLFGKIF